MATDEHADDFEEGDDKEIKLRRIQAQIVIERWKICGKIATTAIVCAAIVICVLGLCFTVYKAVETKPWLQVIAIAAGLAASYFGSQKSVRVVRSTLKTEVGRIKSLEQTQDINRSSSGVNEDGSCDYD